MKLVTKTLWLLLMKKIKLKCNFVDCNSVERIKKINEIVNKFLLGGDKFIPEMHLKQTGFTYSACGPY